MSKVRKSFLLRLNPDLYREIDRWAQQEFRSVNGQIEYLLREAVNRRRKRKTTEERDGDRDREG